MVTKPVRKWLKVTRTLAKRVLKVVDAGLTEGVGEPVPGKMCVEAAVNYAMGLPHGDEPPCVMESARRLKIRINDQDTWESKTSRAKGLRRVAVAQLGSNTLSDVKFLTRLIPLARRLAKKDGSQSSKDALAGFEQEIADIKADIKMALKGGDDFTEGGIADAVDFFSVILDRIGNEKELVRVADAVAKILVQMGSPGAEFLDLTEE